MDKNAQDLALALCNVPAPHVASWQKNLADVIRLLDIHGHIAGAGAGRKRDVQVLHKSALILLLACWESYVEDLAENAFDRMLEHAKGPLSFPVFVLAIAAKDIKNADTQVMWALAGDGWRTALREHKGKIVARYTEKGNFNTPSPENVDRLFSELIGLTSLSSHWKWKGMTSAVAKDKLTKLIDQRGQIAHRVQASQAVGKKDVLEYIDLISRFAAITHNRVTRHILVTTGKAVWKQYAHKATR